jgi:hypothetical protein
MRIEKVRSEGVRERDKEKKGEKNDEKRATTITNYLQVVGS